MHFGRAGRGQSLVVEWGSKDQDQRQQGGLTFPRTDTRTPYLAKFDGPDANKVAHYMLHRKPARDETGPGGETASATIGAQA